MPAKPLGRCPGCGARANGSCAACRKAGEAARGSAHARGYDRGHRALHDRWATRIERGDIVHCWRCRTQITRVADLHIGHDDDDRRITRGPEHAKCNLAAAGRASHTPREVT